MRPFFFSLFIDMNALNGKKSRLIRSMAHLLELQYDDSSFFEHKIILFNADDFIKMLDIILKSAKIHIIESQSASLNIIVKITEWLILNNIQISDDTFFQNVWNLLNRNDNDAVILKFNRNTIIRLLSHSIYGYPMNIDEHKNVCTCKQIPIDWNAVGLFFASIDNISKG